MSVEQEIAEICESFREDPLGYVMFAFPWDEDQSIQVVPMAEGVEKYMTDEDRWRRDEYRKRYPECKFGPDLWACDFLDQWGKEIKKREFDGTTPVDPIRFTTVSGHEIGKTCVVAWLIKFIMDTRPFSKGSVTAVTDEQLRTKTWAELGKWHHMSITDYRFKYSTGRGSMSFSHINPGYAGRWRCDARTCREEKSESFAGQHAPTATSFYIFDEASGIGNKVFEVREGGLTSGEPMVFDFGNGTRNSGYFYENCAGKYANRYITRSIDSRTVFITNKKKIEEDINDYGMDSDFIRTRWLGKFPEKGTSQFIATDKVEEACRREVVEDRTQATVMGVDVARFGDDESCIGTLTGYDFRSHPPILLSGLDTVQLVGQVSEQYTYLNSIGLRVANIFVDETGMGAGVVDQLRHLGFPVTGVNFGSKPLNSDKYRYRVDEMWGKVRDSMEKLCLPDVNTQVGLKLFEDLTQREFAITASGGKIYLEPKDEMKKRGLRSPDVADALALCFSHEVAPVYRESDPTLVPHTENFEYDFNPFNNL